MSRVIYLLLWIDYLWAHVQQPTKTQIRKTKKNKTKQNKKSLDNCNAIWENPSDVAKRHFEK